MKKGTSLYLDLVRFLAAFAVLLDHVSARHFTGGVLWRVGHEGQPAVAVFFVLSGFVIGYVLETRERSFLDYSAGRFGRLYSVVLPALLLTFVCDYFGSLKDPQLYHGWENSIPQNLLTALFLNRIWLVNGSHGFEPGTDSPFWSLSFEVAYYAAIAIIVFLRGWMRVGAVMLLTGIVGPAIALLAPLWFAGYALFRWRRRIRVSAMAASVAMISGLVICLLSFLLIQFRAPWNLPAIEPFDFPSARYHQLGYLACRYAAAAGFALNLVGFLRLSDTLSPVLERYGRWIRTLGALTFPLYLFHRPLLYFLASYSVWPLASAQQCAWLIGGTMIFVATVGIVCERSKLFYKRAYLRTYGRILWWTKARTTEQGV